MEDLFEAILGAIDQNGNGEIDIEDEKIIQFVNGLVGFPDMVDFVLIHDEEKGPGGIAWLQSMQEPQFAIPVMDPLKIKDTYNPNVEDELLKPLGEFGTDDMLVDTLGMSVLYLPDLIAA